MYILYISKISWRFQDRSFGLSNGLGVWCKGGNIGSSRSCFSFSIFPTFTVWQICVTGMCGGNQQGRTPPNSLTKPKKYRATSHTRREIGGSDTTRLHPDPIKSSTPHHKLDPTTNTPSQTQEQSTTSVCPSTSTHSSKTPFEPIVISRRRQIAPNRQGCMRNLRKWPRRMNMRGTRRRRRSWTRRVLGWLGGGIGWFVGRVSFFFFACFERKRGRKG